MTVASISNFNSDSVGTLSLIATKTGKLVTFASVGSGSTFNKGINVQAMGGVAFTGSVRARASPSVLNSGLGTVTVSSSQSLLTQGQQLKITADGIDFGGLVSTGFGALIINCYSAGQSVGLGAGAGSLSIDGSEFDNIVSRGMLIGGSQCGSQTLDGVLASEADRISQILTMMASRDDTTVTFVTTGSSFNSLSVQADDGIIAKQMCQL